MWKSVVVIDAECADEWHWPWSCEATYWPGLGCCPDFILLLLLLFGVPSAVAKLVVVTIIIDHIHKNRSDEEKKKVQCRSKGVILCVCDCTVAFAPQQRHVWKPKGVSIWLYSTCTTRFKSANRTILSNEVHHLWFHFLYAMWPIDAGAGVLPGAATIQCENIRWIEDFGIH